MSNVTHLHSIVEFGNLAGINFLRVGELIEELLPSLAE